MRRKTTTMRAIDDLEPAIEDEFDEAVQALLLRYEASITTEMQV